MNEKTKHWLLAAGALVLLGCILFAGTLAAQGWDITKLSTTSLETNTYAGKERFHDIEITTDTADVTFAVSEDGTYRVVCREAENAKHSVAVQNDTLTIENNTPKTWYAHIGLSFDTPQITVYLPQTQYRALCITGSTGNADIPKEFTFERAEITLSTGSADFAASVSQTAKITTTTGNICVENISAGALELSVTTGAAEISGVRCQNGLTASVTTGAVRMQDVSCGSLASSGDTGSITLKDVVAAGDIWIERSTGHVAFEACDAEELHVKTDTGCVTGSLLSDKIFFAQSDVGSVNVPKTTTGGICEITTDTGAIKITVG